MRTIGHTKHEALRVMCLPNRPSHTVIIATLLSSPLHPCTLLSSLLLAGWLALLFSISTVLPTYCSLMHFLAFTMSAFILCPLTAYVHLFSYIHPSWLSTSRLSSFSSSLYLSSSLSSPLLSPKGCRANIATRL